jgi:ABC-type bacteriocin/lantibiotic exporter with double-glycine peptidase domain
MSETIDKKASLGSLTHTSVPQNHAKMTIRNLNFRYGKTVALADISLDLPENRVPGLIGPSGCVNPSLTLFPPYPVTNSRKRPEFRQ